MKRRSFIEFLSAFYFVRTSKRSIVRIADVKKMEFVNLWNHIRFDDNPKFPIARVTMNGEDISSSCFRAVEYDDGKLIVHRYVIDERGRYGLSTDGHSVATYVEVGTGSITFL